MIVPVPPAVSAPSLETAFLLARAAARPAAAPTEVLSGSGPLDGKLAAIDVLHSRVPTEPKPRRIADLDALAAAATSAAQPPEVRAKALAYLGYAMPQVPDDAARSRGLKVLLDALRSPAYRIYALRGLGPACHGLPEADDALLQGALLDLLDGPVSGEERETALLALYAFVSTRDDLATRAPGLVSQLDDRLLAPIEADPAGFVADGRETPGARALTAAILWSSARHRQTLGNPAPAARVNALLDRLLALEPDPGTRDWLKNYRDAAPPAKGLRDSTVNRAPAGPDEP
ncbi:MAG: hypothetical protein KGL74_01095 [Elusimicrobia bacterium]|nr:hypothetical protein [Elusimicrobiota bacterium]